MGNQAQGTDSQTKLERIGELADRVGSLRPSDPNLRRGLRAGIAIIVALSVGLAAVAAVGDLPSVHWRFHPWALLLSVLGLAIFLIGNAEIWRRLLRALGPEIEPLRAQAIWFASVLGRYAPTALLLPVLRVAMAEGEGAPKRITLASTAYELALFFTAVLILSAYFVIDLPDLRGDPQRFAVLAAPALALVALHPRVFHTLADGVLERLGRAKLPLSLPEARVIRFIGLYCLTFLLAGLSVYALAQSVYPLGGRELATVIGAFAVGTALSVLAFMLPGGLVAREAGIAVALSPVMPTAPAVAVAVLARIVQMGLEVLLAVLTSALARGRKRDDLAADRP